MPLTKQITRKIMVDLMVTTYSVISVLEKSLVNCASFTKFAKIFPSISPSRMVLDYTLEAYNKNSCIHVNVIRT